MDYETLLDAIYEGGCSVDNELQKIKDLLESDLFVEKRIEITEALWKTRFAYDVFYNLDKEDKRVNAFDFIHTYLNDEIEFNEDVASACLKIMVEFHSVYPLDSQISDLLKALIYCRLFNIDDGDYKDSCLCAIEMRNEIRDMLLKINQDLKYHYITSDIGDF